jgi:hypothetical protein
VEKFSSVIRLVKITREKWEEGHEEMKEQPKGEPTPLIGR